jgi:hypothetical protein
VLTPAEINALHSLENHWSVGPERQALVAGNTDYENLNECVFREFNSDIEYVIKNHYNGVTYTNTKDDPQEKVLLLADYISSSLAEEYTRESCGTTATFRTDASCIAATTVDDSATYINRGYLTITFDKDADISKFKGMNDHRDFGDIKPGGTYTYMIESLWFMNIASGRPLGIREFDVTGGAYKQWQ